MEISVEINRIQPEAGSTELKVNLTPFLQYKFAFT